MYMVNIDAITCYLLRKPVTTIALGEKGCCLYAVSGEWIDRTPLVRGPERRGSSVYTCLPTVYNHQLSTNQPAKHINPLLVITFTSMHKDHNETSYDEIILVSRIY